MSAGVSAVVDYGLCNIDSMCRALEECGARHVEPTRDPRVLDTADRIILPGVGTFARAMTNLRDWGLLDVIRHAATRGVPILGSCLGMQLMAKIGVEGSEKPVEGIGLIAGEVVPLVPNSADEHLPHMGWNEVAAKPSSRLMKGVPENADFYFVHSFQIQLADDRNEAGRTPYCGGFTSVIEIPGQAVFGTQFHPEKSQKNGFKIIQNFLAI